MQARRTTGKWDETDVHQNAAGERAGVRLALPELQLLVFRGGADRDHQPRAQEPELPVSPERAELLFAGTRRAIASSRGGSWRVWARGDLDGRRSPQRAHGGANFRDDGVKIANEEGSIAAWKGLQTGSRPKPITAAYIARRCRR